ncbi:hypothetical protein [Hymenobacter ruber]
MKIIERREYTPATARLTCAKCHSVMEVTKADVSSDRDGDYIKCPVCDKFNGVPLDLNPSKLAKAYYNK